MEAFRQLDVCGRALALAGCHSVELQIPLAEDKPVVVSALWDDPAAYDEWLTSPSRLETTTVIDELLASPPEAVLYDVPVAAGDVAGLLEDRR